LRPRASHQRRGRFRLVQHRQRHSAIANVCSLPRVRNAGLQTGNQFAAAVLKLRMGKMMMAQVALGILLTFPTFASPDNPYLPIVDRNVFKLREPVPPPLVLPPTTVVEENVELILTGVVDFRLGRWALITRTERGKPPRGYTLSVGEREDDLQLLDIDAQAGTVRLLRGSAEVVLSLNKDGRSTPSKLEELGRKYVQQAKPFVDEHTRAHAAREQREAQRREFDRATAAAELARRGL